MLRTYLYISDHINNKIETIAKILNRRKAFILRCAIDAGLKTLAKENVMNQTIRQWLMNETFYRLDNFESDEFDL